MSQRQNKLEFETYISKAKIAEILHIKPENISETKIEVNCLIEHNSDQNIQKIAAMTDDTKNIPKLGRKIEAPKLTDLTAESVEIFIEDLLYVNKLNAFHSEQELIYSSLRNSEMTKLFRSMNDDQRTKIEEFAKFLRGIYGLSEYELFTRLNNIKQDDGESETQFFARVTREFTELKGTKMSELSTFEKNEIRNLFLKGMKNAKARKQLLMNQASITFEQLGETAKNYSKVLGYEKDTVHFIENTASETTDERIIKKIDQLTERINAVSFKGDESRHHDTHYYRGRNRSRDRYRSDRSSSQDRRFRDRGSGRCFRCGIPGHKYFQCHASDKTVTNYRKQQANFHQRRNSYSRSRERTRRPQTRDHQRSYPRDRSGERYHRSPYRSDRDYSRERSRERYDKQSLDRSRNRN